jgi:hypothetical protein
VSYQAALDGEKLVSPLLVLKVLFEQAEIRQIAPRESAASRIKRPAGYSKGTLPISGC